MYIDPKTMMFNDLTASEAEILLNLVQPQIFTGIVPQHPFVALWMEECGFTKVDHHPLLAISSIFPQRALLSLVEYYRVQKKDLLSEGSKKEIPSIIPSSPPTRLIREDLEFFTSKK
jgi:hypothetical protein